MGNSKPIKNGKKRSNRSEKGKFLPGNPGGPGRPSGSTSIKDILRRIGMKEIETPEGKMTKQEAVMRAVYKFALQGRAWAVHFIADRLEGKAVETVKHESDKDEIIIIG